MRTTTVITVSTNIYAIDKYIPRFSLIVKRNILSIAKNIFTHFKKIAAGGTVGYFIGVIAFIAFIRPLYINDKGQFHNPEVEKLFDRTVILSTALGITYVYVVK